MGAFMLRVLAILLFLFSFSFSQEIPQELINKIEKNQQTNELKNTQITKPYEPYFPSKKQEIETKEEIPEKTEVEKTFEKETLSNIEKIYNERIGKEIKEEKLKQFGYDFFKNYKVYEMGPVGDNYVLGPGDIVLLYLWGDPVDILNLEGFYSLKIDREGKIYIPHLGVFYIWGLTVKEAKDLLRREFAKKFKNFRIELSLGKIRSYPVYVSGYVENPGVVLVNATQSVIDALSLSGGITKNGSLRNIILTRKNGKKINIDLYELLLKGKPINISLKEGDAIYVEPIGKTAAIYGSVKRPAIYELKDSENIKELVKFSGGLLPSVYGYGFKLYRYENNNLSLLNGKLDDKSFWNMKLKDGDLLKIEKIYNFKENVITVKGYVKYPGDYSVKDYDKLSKLISKVGLLPDTNQNYVEIVRIKNDNTKEIIKFNLQNVIKGKKDLKLQKLDTVYFYPKWVFKPIEISGEIENPQVVDYYPDITLLDVLRNVKYKEKPRKLKVEIYKNQKSEKIIYLYDLLIKNDPKANIPLEPGIKILVKKVNETEKDKTVTILGEVNKPGIYKYKSGMKLYDLIVLAGGYTEDAYPKALIFIRESAKKLQQEQLQASILAMEEELAAGSEAFQAAGATKEEQALAKIALEKQKRLLQIIKQKAQIGLGRIALNIPSSLKELKNSPDNIELQDGDFIYVPAKPNYILVLGGVYNQISLPYRKNKTVEWYLKEVGGLKENAKEDDLYIIKANGRVISKRNFDSDIFEWQENKLVFGKDFYSMRLEQGDTIVVPTEVKVPILWRPLIKDVTQIIFQALSTAVLAKRL